MAEPCPKCKGNRWKTVINGKKYVCRICHYVREIKETKRGGDQHGSESRR
jgi:ssDNA-binding Zn-finger/Zn-ribbon topoisomerase 1